MKYRTLKWPTQFHIHGQCCFVSCKNNASMRLADVIISTTALSPAVECYSFALTWSYLRIHFIQTLQWCARSGFGKWPFNEEGRIKNDSSWSTLLSFSCALLTKLYHGPYIVYIAAGTLWKLQVPLLKVGKSRKKERCRRLETKVTYIPFPAGCRRRWFLPTDMISKNCARTRQNVNHTPRKTRQRSFR